MVSVTVTFEIPEDVAAVMDDICWEDYVTMDETILTNKTLEDNWEEEILRKNPTQEATESDVDEEEEDYEPIRDIIPYRVASTHLEDLHLFALIHEDQEMMDLVIKCQHRLESKWTNYKKNTTQTTITDFFEPKQ